MARPEKAGTGSAGSGRRHGIDRRAHPRCRVLQPGLLLAGRYPRALTMLIASRSGALCEMASPPQGGADVLIEVLATSISARVIWRSGNRFGLSFYTAMTPAWLEMLVALAPCPSVGANGPPRGRAPPAPVPTGGDDGWSCGVLL